MTVTPYLFFDGRCEEALDFYKTALGAKIEMMMRFKDNPDPPKDADLTGKTDKIMHAAFSIGGSRLMASDGYAHGTPVFLGFSLSIDAKDEAEAEKIFATLSDGGKVQMPLAKTFYARRFGMVTDRFGIGWMVIAE